MKRAFSLVEFLLILIIIGVLYATLAPKIKEWIGLVDDAKANSISSSIKTSIQNIQTNYMVTQKVNLKDNIDLEGFKLIENRPELLEFEKPFELNVKFQIHQIDGKNGIFVTIKSKKFELLSELSENLQQSILDDNQSIEYRVNFDEKATW